MGLEARSVALVVILVFLGGTLVGSLAPEKGTVLARTLGLPSHIFNWGFLVIGIAGVVVACAFGFRGGG